MRGDDRGGPAAASRAGRPAWRGGLAAGAMLSGLAGATAVAACGLPAAAVAHPAVAHPAAARAWRVIKGVPGADAPAITAVTATGTGHAWAFQSTSAKPAAWQLTGTSWAKVAFPGRSGDQVTAAGSSSPRDVWAFTSLPGGAGRALRWNGQHWAIARQFRQAIGGAVVLGRADVWIFGAPLAPGAGLGTWHYDGHRWHRFRGLGELTGGSALRAGSVWAVGGKTAAHWTGRAWTATSLARVLPRNTRFCRPSADLVYAFSPGNVWAAGAGHCEDERGPFYLLHFNGRRWRLVFGSAAYGQPLQLAPDGSGGLWIPTVAGFPGRFSMLHYRAGHLRRAVLPRPGTRMTVGTVGHVPHSAVTFGGGASYPANRPGTRQVAVILRYPR